MTDLNYQIGQGASALDQQQEQDRLDGYAVVSGYGVSPGTGLEVDVAAGTALFGVDANGDANLVSSGSTQTVALTAADSTNPRKDVIYVQADGTVTKETGVAREAKPGSATRFNTFQPEPYSMHDIEGVVLAEVWVGAGDTALSSNDIRDRRQSATAVHEELITKALRAGEVTAGSTAHGENPAETITDSSSPKDLSFAGSDDRDIHDQTDVAISNSSGASATEDVTVTLYDGTDNTGTQLASETQSITLADGGSTTATFITADEPLDNGDYFIEVTQSGTALSIDSTTEYTKGATHTISQSATGKLQVTNQDDVTEASIDPISGRTSFEAVDTDELSYDLAVKQNGTTHHYFLSDYADFSAMVNDATATHGRHAKYDFSAGEYDVPAPLDFTELRNIEVDLLGTQLTGTTDTMTAIVDASNTQDSHFAYGRLTTATGVTAQTAILNASYGANSTVSWNIGSNNTHYVQGRVYGQFSVAPFAATLSGRLEPKGQFMNQASQGTVLAFQTNSGGKYSLSSDYGTIEYGSVEEPRIENCYLRSRGGSGDSMLYLEGYYIRGYCERTEFEAYGEPTIVEMDASNQTGQPFSMDRIGVHQAATDSFSRFLTLDDASAGNFQKTLTIKDVDGDLGNGSPTSEGPQIKVSGAAELLDPVLQNLNFGGWGTGFELLQLRRGDIDVKHSWSASSGHQDTHRRDRDDNWTGADPRSTDPAAPSSGVRYYYYDDGTSLELRGINSAGTVSTIATF